MFVNLFLAFFLLLSEKEFRGQNFMTKIQEFNPGFGAIYIKLYTFRERRLIN
jgi:hypothetical protein